MAVLAAWIVVVVISKIWFPTFRNTTRAMEPTIAAGDHVMAQRNTPPRRGDLIVFRYPLKEETVFLKRVVGMPGDVVQIRAKTLYINGDRAIDPHAVHTDEQTYPDNPALPEPYRSRDYFGPYRVPEEQFFVMGDNRDLSSDSRYWGTVPQKNVIGRVILVSSRQRGFWRP